MRAAAAAAAAAFCAGAARGSDPDAGFLDWIRTSLDEVDGRELHFSGAVPAWFPSGTFVQSGPARFEVGDEHFGHAFDGFAKINRYTFNASGNGTGDGVRAKFSASFLRSSFYQASLREGRIAASILGAETEPASRRRLGPLNALGHNDNNYIKPRRIAGREAACSDTAIVVEMAHGWENITETVAPFGLSLLQQRPNAHWAGKLDGVPDDHLCMMATFAHGYAEPNGDYMVASSCLALVPHLYRDYYVLYKIAADGDMRQRTHVATVKLPKGRLASYMHQNAVTEHFYVIIGVPLHVDIPAILGGRTMTNGALVVPPNETTLFHVIDKRTGAVRQFEAPGFEMGHVVNAYEEGGDVVFDLTWYAASTGGFFPRWTLAVVQDKARRDAWRRSDVVRFRLKADGSVERSLPPHTELGVDMELPSINPRYESVRHCVFWALQFHADGGRGGRGSDAGSVARIAYVKRNVCTGERAVLFRDNHYPSEHQFIPRPGASEEDDGVLVGVVFDGARNNTQLELLDGKTLRVVANASLGIAVPFPIHSTWFGGAAPSA